MSDETLLVQHIKEVCCFVPAAFGNHASRPEGALHEWSFRACEWACG